MTRFHRLGVIARWSVLGAGALVLGCADQATAPRTLLPDTPSRVAVGDITDPTPTNEVLRVCKVWVNHSLDDIGISWTGSASGSTTIPGSDANSIQCKVIEIQGATGQWTITVTEDDPGANVTTTWTRTSTISANDGSGSGTSATATIGSNGTPSPEGSTIIFTNTYTPPPGEGRMTGGGFKIGDLKVTSGFTIHCDILLSNNLELNWGDNKWHIDKPLTSATCFDDPAYDETPPVAPFNTFVGEGVGKLNGVDGSVVKFTFIDAGEPGKNDMVQIQVFPPGGGSPVLDIPLGKIQVGNIQAHYDQPHGQHP